MGCLSQKYVPLPISAWLGDTLESPNIMTHVLGYGEANPALATCLALAIPSINT